MTLGCLGAGAAAAGARIVRYHGYGLDVPASWPVYELARDPTVCVRFDRHAVYLGTPGAAQQCPAHAVGRTEAILLSPVRADAASAARSGAGGSGVGGSGVGGSGVGGLVAAGGPVASVDLPGAGLTATVTWSGDRALVARILGRRLAGSAAVRPAVVRPAAVARPAASAHRSAGPVARAAEAAYDGLGFDACATPSTTTLDDWGSSPYRAIGVYIGGINEACAQPNLSSEWVTEEVAAGWHLIPTYVGYQGRGACGGTCATINPSAAASEGSSDAAIAVNDAQSVGIPAGNPIYDDMEQFTGSFANDTAVLAYLSAWTAQLHGEGYLSGVYGSGSSAVTQLVDEQGTGYLEPDDIWVADWNGARTTSDPYVPAGDWSGQQRIHQYDGGHDETWSGARINIDGDFVDGATVSSGSGESAGALLDGTFVQVIGTSSVYRIAGGAPLLVSSWAGFGGPQPVQLITQQQLDALPAYPADGTFVESTSGAVYRIAGGAPVAVSSWAVFGSPQPVVEIDQWDIANTANCQSHLLPYPINGTVVEGLPSDSYWSFATGLRSPAASESVAIQVDDAGLAGFAQQANEAAAAATGSTSSSSSSTTSSSTSSTGSSTSSSTSSTTSSSTTSSSTSTSTTSAEATPTTSTSTTTTSTTSTTTIAPPPPTAGTDPCITIPKAVPAPPPPVKHCVVPRLHRLTLRQARLALRRASCRVGSIRRPRHVRRHHVLRVLGQSAHVASVHPAGHRVNLLLR